MKRITADMLSGACLAQLNVFKRRWPKGAAVNATNAKRAGDLGLCPIWTAEKLLRRNALKQFWAKRKPINDEYLAKRNPIDEDHYGAYRAKCWKVLWPILAKEPKP